MERLDTKKMKKTIQKLLHNSTDLKFREFVSFAKIDTIVFFFDTIADVKRADKEVILQLMQNRLPDYFFENTLNQTTFKNSFDLQKNESTGMDTGDSAGGGIDKKISTKDKPFADDSVVTDTSAGVMGDSDVLIDYAIDNAIIVGQCEVVSEIEQVFEKILNGFFAVYFSNSSKFLVVDVKNFESRAIAEPPTNAVLKGPREGFNESLVTGIMLMRKRLKTSDLVVKQMAVGRFSQTQVAMVYIDSIADDKVIAEVEKNISEIDIDGIVDAYYVQKALEERDYSLFKQVGSTEKPDIAVAKILEGRVAVLVDGTPMCLTVPFLLIEDIQSSNDYYFTRSPRVTFLRYLRAFGVLISIFLPGFYVALQVYHYKVVPLKFLVTIANSSQGIPFTPLMEVLFIIVLFEGLTEASLRMPRYLGLALSIVGALILGETAVNAGLVSPPAVMIVALTGVLIYTVPDEQAQLSTLRLIFTLIGGTLGLYGMVVFSVFLVGYLCNFDSYGTPYLAPFAPNIPEDKKDAFKRANLAEMKTRPKSIPQKNKNRLNKL